jgi:pyridoxal phosphate enzyme (YggS family)
MQTAQKILEIKNELPKGVKLVAVSKTKPPKTILEAYQSGHRIFGENKVQELVSKYEELPKDIEWHMIGHLQRNKVKFIAPFVSLIHGVDSIKLLKEINKEGEKHDRIISCLLQIKIGQEETKFGLSQQDVEELLSSNDYNMLANISIEGVMGMATYTTNEEIIRSEFRKLYSIFKSIKERHFQNSQNFTEISMGMSNDYKIAIEEGATLLRIGSSIFGERIYI